MKNTNSVIAGARTHTPGPWRTGERYPCRIFTDRKSVSERQPIGSTCEAQDEGTETEEQIANARLIAATPELLTILQRFYSATYGHTDLIPQLDFEQARTAISKSQGTFTAR